jgi:hypothetical protein
MGGGLSVPEQRPHASPPAPAPAPARAVAWLAVPSDAGDERVQHRGLKLDLSARDLSTVNALNAFFVAGTEFTDACKEFPVVWVAAAAAQHRAEAAAGGSLVADD